MQESRVLSQKISDGELPLVGNRVMRKCIHCGKEWACLKCEIRKAHIGKFCSRDCTFESRRAAAKPKSILAWNTPASEKKERVRAAALINMRIRRGKLERPNSCEECGKAGRTDAHHNDYKQPEKVKFICRSCHMKRHWRKVG